MLQRSLYLSICFSMMISFCSFAGAYTGAYVTYETDPTTGVVTMITHDVNPTGQTYSGSNQIKLNAYNNAPQLTDNTFNGSTSIEPAFTDITSTGNTYNGTTTVSYDGLLGGNLESNSDSFSTTSVEASNADVEFNNPSFNGNVTLSASNISVGSISQMDSLLDLIFSILYHLNNNYSTSVSSVNVTNPATGNTVNIPLTLMAVYTATYQDGNISFTGTTNYGTLFARFNSWYDFVFTWFRAISQYLVHSGTYDIYSFTADGEYYSISPVSSTSNFINVLINRQDMLLQLVKWHCDKFFNWYYPLDNVLPEYWRYYNTDTKQSEEIGLAGLMYNISWYLGQLYALQVESGPLAQLADDVEDAADSMASMEQSEEAVINSVSSSITSFVPDISQIGSFTALAWCSNYLQQCWVSLGMYGTVIIIALMLGVCLQFIGYFRYK